MALILELLFKAMGPRTVRQFHEACLNPAKTQATSPLGGDDARCDQRQERCREQAGWRSNR